MSFDLSNPIILIIGGILLLALIAFWNRRNVSKQSERRNRNFRKSYYQRKKERDKKS